eukprot:CAMPEP_0172175368 /NCGR_PEP_ID=MMETSP1050-20130122/14187_1 /TAXON_ID=233186 /ORGANISM="Cryptomonas curvata, Strain CCAP979/52" /LENGTH=362 /DNA_ID=CAMNT_0012847459 /DNA_START=383 /DNA_END=1472 /DNA_ORIENTATION=-
MVLLQLTEDAGCRIRGARRPDGDYWYSVFDFMMKACAYTDSASARKEFERLTKDGSEYKDEVVALCHYFKFPGQGQRDTPVMTIRGLQRLLMILGGKVAAEFRRVVEQTFTRVLAGDLSLIDVIQANNASSAPLQQAYRNSLAREAAGGSGQQQQQRRRGDAPHRAAPQAGARRDGLQAGNGRAAAEAAHVEADGKSKMADAHAKMAEAHTKDLTVCRLTMDTYADLCPGKVMDDRMRLMFKDSVANLYFAVARAQQQPGSTQPQQMSQNPTQPQPQQPAADANLNKHITISTLAATMGRSFTSGDLQKIGKQAAAAYRRLHNDEEPSKHEQWVGGANILVNSYTERDRSMLEDIIANYIHG